MHRLSRRNLIDVRRHELDFGDKGIAIGHDMHDRLARCDDSARRMDYKLVDDASLRRANVDTLEFILGRHQPF